MHPDLPAIARVIDAMYAMVSGPAGPRDWSGQEAIFHPDARQTRTGLNADGTPWRQTMTLAEYAESADAILSTIDFFEIETGREVRIFGNIAHVWSAYEARAHPDDPQVERRGINSIQLYRDAPGRWRITSMIWDNERPGLEIDRAPFA